MTRGERDNAASNTVDYASAFMRGHLVINELIAASELTTNATHESHRAGFSSDLTRDDVRAQTVRFYKPPNNPESESRITSGSTGFRELRSENLQRD